MVASKGAFGIKAAVEDFGGFADGICTNLFPGLQIGACGFFVSTKHLPGLVRFQRLDFDESLTVLGINLCAMLRFD